MRNRTIKLIEMIDGIVNPASLAFVINQIREYFARDNRRLPPLPENAFQLIPSDLLITSVPDEQGKETGTIAFSKPEGGAEIYRAEWVLSEGRP